MYVTKIQPTISFQKANGKLLLISIIAVRSGYEKAA